MGLPKENCNRSLSTTHKTTGIFDLAPKGNPPGPSPTYTRGAEDNERETPNKILTQEPPVYIITQATHSIYHISRVDPIRSYL